MTIVSPSLLSADFLNLRQEIEAFDKAEQIWFHLDVMDGHYVPNLTFGHTVLKDIHKTTKHKLDAHLMVSNPELYIDQFANLGLHNLTFHWEACLHQDSMIAEIKKRYPSVGVSLNPATPLEVMPEYIFNNIDLLLIMSVNPGFGGQSFIEGVVDKIKKANELRKRLGLSFKIQVDGGITDKNAKMLRQAGADILVAGSYIFGAEEAEYINRVESLR